MDFFSLQATAVETCEQGCKPQKRDHCNHGCGYIFRYLNYIPIRILPTTYELLHLIISRGLDMLLIRKYFLSLWIKPNLYTYRILNTLAWALWWTFVASREQKINGVHVVFVTSFINRSCYHIKSCAGKKAIQPFFRDQHITNNILKVNTEYSCQTFLI